VPAAPRIAPCVIPETGLYGAPARTLSKKSDGLWYANYCGRYLIRTLGGALFGRGADSVEKTVPTWSMEELRFLAAYGHDYAGWVRAAGRLSRRGLCFGISLLVRSPSLCYWTCAMSAPCCDQQAIRPRFGLLRIGVGVFAALTHHMMEAWTVLRPKGTIVDRGSVAGWVGFATR